MATDYDAPRVAEPDADESLEELTSRRKNDAATAVIDVDDGDAVDSFDLPDADLTGCSDRLTELNNRVWPRPGSDSHGVVDARDDLQPAGATWPRRGPWIPWAPASPLSPFRPGSPGGPWMPASA